MTGVIIRTRVQLDLPFSRAPHAGRVSHPAFSPLPTPELCSPVKPLEQTGQATEPDVEFVRMRRARRYILRVRPGGGLRVTIPRGGSRAEAARFILKHAVWVGRERLRVLSTGAPVEWRHGAVLLLRGQPVTVEDIRDHGRRIVRYGERILAVPGEAVDLRRYIEADLRLLARTELGPRLHALASAHGVTAAGVTIRNQKSRWGSCSRAGWIALNFRLVQMPPHVSDYVLLHELMHLEQQNHSRRFWRLVESACPDFRAAERWLKTDGRRLF